MATLRFKPEYSINGLYIIVGGRVNDNDLVNSISFTSNDVIDFFTEKGKGGEEDITFI